MLEPLAPGVALVPLRTPTLPPATHTNCLFVGEERLAIIEPASPFADEQRRLDLVVSDMARRGRRVEAILVTHHHPDHVGYAAELARRLCAPLCAHAQTAARLPFPVDRLLGDRSVVDLGSMHIEARFTPGHAPGHLVYFEPRSGIAHAGDMVAGTGTILIDPSDGGDMTEYLESLRILGSLGARLLVPAHGPIISECEKTCRRYVAHRLMREQKVVEAIGAGAHASAVLARAYDDTSPLLWPIARRSLEAHLIKLEREARIRREGEEIYPLGSG